MTERETAVCRECGNEIRRVAIGGWGHVKAYTVKASQPLHRARP